MDNDYYYIRVNGLKNLEKAIALLEDNNIKCSLPNFTQYSKEDWERWDIIILDNK